MALCGGRCALHSLAFGVRCTLARQRNCHCELADHAWVPTTVFPHTCRARVQWFKNVICLKWAWILAKDSSCRAEVSSFEDRGHPIDDSEALALSLLDGGLYIMLLKSCQGSGVSFTTSPKEMLPWSSLTTCATCNASSPGRSTARRILRTHG